ncbi:MAG: PilZ domain-containing protein [Wenzhouxiangella sp.]
MSEDRRQFQRVTYECPARLAWAGQEPVAVEVENLSLKGVLLRGLPEKHALKPGQSAQLEIRLAPEVSMSMALEVAFSSATRLGACWVEIDLEGMTHLRRLLALNLGDAEQVDDELARMLHPAP